MTAISVCYYNVFLFVANVAAKVAADPPPTSTPAGDTDISKTISSGFGTVYKLIKDIANPIIMISLACMGLYLLIGSDPKTIQKVKGWAISLICGAILINVADKIANWAAKLGTGGK